MLLYVSSGSRSFGSTPLAPTRRAGWEFYAALSGRIAPLAADGSHPPPRGNTLWLFGPGHEHGWIARAGQPTRIAVFHFDEVPAKLRAAMPESGVLAVTLTDRARREVRRLARELQPVYWRPGEWADLQAQRGLLDLSLLVLSARAASPATGETVARVEAAEAWYRTHLAERPTVTHLARHAGVTEGHFRRLVRNERRCSPKQLMARVQMEQAAPLLEAGNLKLEVIAHACGFASASSLCKFFKHETGRTPRAWRAWRRSLSPRARTRAR